MGWLVRYLSKYFARLDLFGKLSEDIETSFETFRQELRTNLRINSDRVKDSQRRVDIFIDDAKQELRKKITQVQAKIEVVNERSETIAQRLLSLEGKIAALEATHHRVGYVPMESFKALSEADIEKMAGVSEQVRDQLREIVSLNERLREAEDPSAFPDRL